MIKEYRTIREIAGPLMMVKNVEGVTYDELAEIELKNGDIRHCKVLEVNGDTAVVQLFENSAGTRRSSPFPATCSAAYLTALANQSTAVRKLWPRHGWISTACR